MKLRCEGDVGGVEVEMFKAHCGTAELEVEFGEKNGTVETSLARLEILTAIFVAVHHIFAWADDAGCQPFGGC